MVRFSTLQTRAHTHTPFPHPQHRHSARSISVLSAVIGGVDWPVDSSVKAHVHDDPLDSMTPYRLWPGVVSISFEKNDVDDPTYQFAMPQYCTRPCPIILLLRSGRTMREKSQECPHRRVPIPATNNHTHTVAFPFLPPTITRTPLRSHSCHQQSHTHTHSTHTRTHSTHSTHSTHTGRHRACLSAAGG